MYILFFVLPYHMLPKASFVLMFSYLSFLHIYRMYTDYMGWSLDATALLMMTTIKLTSLACNYCDGKRKEDEFLTEMSLKNAITEIPPLLTYFSFLCFFPTILSGPPFHYKEYVDFLNGDIYKDEKYNPKGEVPNSTMATLECVAISIVCVVIYVGLDKIFPVDILFEPNGMDHMNYFVRHIYFWICLFGNRFKYYFIWKLSEGAGMLAGFGFLGYDKKTGKPIFTRLTNIYIWNIEIFGCLRDIAIYWNYKTGEWLKNYVYLRQTRNPNKDRVPIYALYLTNTLSGFWHGFYPGYYFCFVWAAITTDISRQIRSALRPMVTMRKDRDEIKIYPIFYIYDITGRFVTLFTFNFGYVAFQALSATNTLTCYKNLGYSGWIVAVLFFMGLNIYKMYFLPREDDKKKQ